MVTATRDSDSRVNQNRAWLGPRAGCHLTTTEIRAFSYKLVCWRRAVVGFEFAFNAKAII